MTGSEDGAEGDAELLRDVDTVRVVRIVPADPLAAPVTLALTRFPGLIVRLGRWSTEAYPACGCDACDEDPAALVHDLEDDVRAVAAGGLQERLQAGARPRARTVLTSAHSRSERTTMLERSEVEQRGGPATYDWRAWTRRR